MASSPINPEIGRNTYADKAAEAAGIKTFMNLANDEATAKGYEGFDSTYYSKQNVVYLNLGVDFTAADFKTGLATGLRYFTTHEGPYLVHCTEGKDRAGFVSALLECYMGAAYDEVVADYMVTYYNYYGVTKEAEPAKYDAILRSNIVKTLQTAFGVNDLKTADLKQEATDFFKELGLTDAELTTLTANLSKKYTGVFTNEAGLGSTPIAAACSSNEDPVRQGLVTMTGTFLDTIVICSLTGLCLVVTGAWCAPGLAGFRITEQAWRTALPWPAGLSSFLLLACLVFFAFSTIIGWNFYGEQCLRYLTGGSQRAQRLYRWCYLAALCAAPLLSVKAAWELADILNACMALPNLTALLLLWRQVVEGSRRPAGKT